MANRPDDMPVEAWVMFLLASNMLRMAVCSALCFATARHAGLGCGHGTCGSLGMRSLAVVLLWKEGLIHRHAHVTLRIPEASTFGLPSQVVRPAAGEGG